MTEERLGGSSDASHLYVTLAAARQFAAATELEIETARRRLTEALLDARPVRGEEGRWRARSRATGLDINAYVVEEGRLDVVVHVHVRRVQPRGPR